MRIEKLKLRIWRGLMALPIFVIMVFLVVFVLINNGQEQTALNDETRKYAPGAFVKLDEGDVHYYLQGPDSAEVVVFVHGGGIAGMEIWEKNIQFFLAEGYRVLAFDLYGRGYSDRPEVKHSPELYHRQLIDLLDTLEISEPVYMVAHSMGAIVALDYLHSSPQRIKKMVLVDPMILGNYEPNSLLKIPVVSTLLMTLYWYPRAVENQRKEFVNQEVFHAYSDRLRYFMDFEGYKKTNYSTWMHTLSQDRVGLLKEANGDEVLIIYGDQDPYFNRNNGLEKFVPFLEIRGAGHLPQYEKPFMVNTSIHSFFCDGCDAGLSSLTFIK